MIANLVLKSLWNRRLSTILTILGIAMSIALLIGMQKIRVGVKDGFSNTISGADLVVGGRTSPVQLLLYSIFHIGNPTNNVSYSTYKEISALKSVEWSVPLSLGDSHRGFRVVGTTADFFDRYKHHGKKPLRFKVGESFAKTYQAVIGSQVAQKYDYKIGQKIVLSHGISAGPLLEQHEEHRFEIVGILSGSGTPIDRSVLVSLGSITAIHLEDESGVHEHEHDLTPTSITAFIVRATSRIDTLQLQRHINEYNAEALTGIIPGVGLSELWQSLDYIEKSFIVLSFLIVAITLLNMLISIYNSLENRRREMAIFRSVGASPLHIGFLYIFESFILTLSGILLGITLLYSSLFFIQPWLLSKFGVYIPFGLPQKTEILMILLVFFTGCLLGFIPFIKSYRMTLADGLEVKS